MWHHWCGWSIWQWRSAILTHLLHRLTLGTLHLLHFETVHFMVLLCIMT